MEKDRAIHVTEIHKLEYVFADIWIFTIDIIYILPAIIIYSLLRYNTDSIPSSSTKGQIHFNDIWSDLINRMQVVLKPGLDILQDVSSENGLANEVEQYFR